VTSSRGEQSALHNTGNNTPRHRTEIFRNRSGSSPSPPAILSQERLRPPFVRLLDGDALFRAHVQVVAHRWLRVVTVVSELYPSSAVGGARFPLLHVLHQVQAAQRAPLVGRRPSPASPHADPAWARANRVRRRFDPSLPRGDPEWLRGTQGAALSQHALATRGRGRLGRLRRRRETQCVGVQVAGSGLILKRLRVLRHTAARRRHRPP
jgi:hypothetical protein